MTNRAHIPSVCLRSISKTLMKHMLYLGMMIMSVCWLGGCQKAPINGDLDGEWEVVEVTPTPPEAEIENRYFYNFSRHVCQLTVYGGSFTLGNLTYDDETIYLDFPFITTESGMQQLKRYGIYTNPVSFNIKFEGKSRLILWNDDSTVVLKKF